MNRFPAVVTQIEAQEQLHLVHFDSFSIPLLMMGLELPVGVKEGSRVMLGCKPSHIIVAKDLTGDISLSNRIPGTLSVLESGHLVSVLHLETPCGPLESLITRASAERMGLQEGISLTALIKASELSIVELVS